MGKVNGVSGRLGYYLRPFSAAPTVATTLDKSYPIARPMYVVTAGEPSAAVKKYLDWILSQPGQDIVTATGYVPAQAQ